MDNTGQCDFCGKKAKIKYICPICGKTYCPDHKNAAAHGCEKTEDIKQPINEQNQEHIMLHEIEQSSEEVYSNLITKNENNECSSNIELQMPEYLFESEINKDNDKNTLKKTIFIEHFSLKQIISILFIIVSLSTLYLYMSGGLFFDSRSDSIKESINDIKIIENYTSIMSKYNNLSIQYTQLESNYFNLNEEYNELKKSYDSAVDFEGTMLLENMKQITIAPDSSTVCFYEIPKPGYITVEFYSNLDLYTFVGSTALDNVYYSRNPQNSRVSEYTFSVPVLPNINIMFSNPNKEEAMIFYRVEYYCN